MLVAGLAFPVPPQVGKISIFTSNWDWSDVDNIIENYDELPTHRCTDIELGRVKGYGKTPHLFPLADGETVVDLMSDPICIDKEDLFLQGAY